MFDAHRLVPNAQLPKTLLLLSGALAFFSVACTGRWVSNVNPDRPTPTATLPSPTPVATPSVVPTPAPSPQIDFFQRALDRAYSAASIAQSAQSQADWQLVEGRWQQAIALLQSIPQQSTQYAIAQTKIVEYRRNLAYAQQQVRGSVTRSQPVVGAILPAPVAAPQVAPVPPAPKTVFRAPIKRRVGGTPVIDVTFNGQQQFEMIVDTGASGILITQSMADALGVVPVGKAKANTASANGVEFLVGIVDSIAVDGAVIRDVPVAIAGSQLDLGLLGHEFLANYDITFRQDAIEFHVR